MYRAMERARAALAAGRGEQAVEVLTEALPAAKGAQRVELLLARAEAHLLGNSAAAASADATTALADDASCGKAWLLKACALRGEGKKPGWKSGPAA